MRLPKWYRSLGNVMCEACWSRRTGFAREEGAPSELGRCFFCGNFRLCTKVWAHDSDARQVFWRRASRWRILPYDTPVMAKLRLFQAFQRTTTSVS